MNHKPCSKGAAIYLWLLFAFLIPFGAFAQSFQLKGTVVDASGEPIIGASVLEKGTTNGIITDLDGRFMLTINPQSSLIVSYVGYKPQTLAVNGRREIKVVLQEDAQMLEETVVIGYGTMKKSDMTGAISSVNVEDLTKRATTNPAEALQGKVAGVNIQKAGGNAGSGVRVRIRGVKSMGDNEPLYIIDGFQGSITSVNPSDIESMEVLKDGAAAAIYGSVAANGVIIITTRNGKKGDLKIDFNSYLSFTNVAKKLEMLNAKEYVQVNKLMYDNYNQYAAPEKQEALPAYISKPGTADTDWQDEVMRGGLAQNYMISARGGSENARYSLSYNHSDEKGIFLGNNYKQDNARAKIGFSKYIFDVDANLSLRIIDSKQPQYSLKEMYMLSPIVPVYDSEQASGYGLTTSFSGLPSNRNIMADNHYKKASNKTYNMSGNVSLGINLTKWLVFKTSYSYTGSHYRYVYHAPAFTADKTPAKYPIHSEKSTYTQEQIADNTLTFNKTFNQHSVNVMIGSSITSEDQTWNSVGVEGKTIVQSVDKNGNIVNTEVPAGFLDPNFSTIGAGNGGTLSGDGSKYTYRRASFFGRVNYSYASKYLLQATIRRDGSSKFGANSRWGTFPSVALGWRISEEGFFPKDAAMNNLKLRMSWGRLGNEQILGAYDFQALITSGNWYQYGYVQGAENPWPGSIATGLENRSLKWETTDTKNIGVDYAFFNNKLTGSVNYYYNKTEDMLVRKQLAPSAGLDNPVLNVGKVRNSGFEFEVNYKDNKGGFDYSVGLNLATTSNKVLELANDGQALTGIGLQYGTAHFPNETRVGKPVGAFYLYQTDGIFQSMDEVNAHSKDGKLIQPNAKPGDIRFKDIDGNGKIGTEDKIYSGSGIPTVEANLSFNGSYKGVDLSLLIGSSWGNELYNGNQYEYEGMGSGSNFLKTTLDAWTPTNTQTNVPRAVYKDPNMNTRESDRFLEKGDFIRLRQIQLGYTLPNSLTRKAYIEKLRFYVSGENLLTWTNYSGIDPDFSARATSSLSNVMSTGLDTQIYPFTRSFIIGLQLTF
ncbi:SusC/RagA family TonB-linked outer membrane protein [Bacteroides neonati]|uniref:SusC/RagA family TonB-linked outer membrane protein n=1 Tax=Bacteroides neonati TaxID=1347393 RepID=UPI0004B9F042|nr:TonB-dependent receptor [Bacteroides neonati]